MPSSRQKNRNSRQTPTATSTKKNSMRSMLLATLVNAPSTASATPVQQASHVDQISDLPTLPNESNASLEEQLKQQQLLINKLMSRINALESHVQLLGGKIATQESVSNLLEQKTDNLEAYSRRPCTILSGIQKLKKESQGNIKTSVLENLQKTGLPLEKIERNIDKLHWVGRFDHETQMQPIIVKFRTHSFKEKIYHQRKKLAKGIKISPSLTKRRSDILQQVQHIIKEESSDDSPNEEDIVKFAFADVHGTLKIVLTKSYKNRHVFAFNSALEYFQIINKVSTKGRYPCQGEFED